MSIHSTVPPPHLTDVLQSILAAMHNALGQRLVGVYLYGSLVTGDFDEQVSDLDLLAVTATDLREQELKVLKQMHDDLVVRYPAWDDRIEVAYLSIGALSAFKSHTSQIAIISPGEPFHVKDAGRDWLINWYLVRENGMTLFGPSPHEFIPPISKAEFMQAVVDQARAWRDRMHQMEWLRPSKHQSYAILTLCRAVHARITGEQVSKDKAAQWAAQQFPEWSYLINNALFWRGHRRDDGADSEATLPQTLTFIRFLLDKILKRNNFVGSEEDVSPGGDCLV